MTARPIHYANISGGKDSTAVACLAMERAQKRDMDLRFITADTENEHDVTYEHIDYLERYFGPILRVRADFADRFPARREAIARDWPIELRRKQHSRGCIEACKQDMGYAEKVLFRDACDCPIKVSPALPDHMVRRAIELMQPTGNVFLDMAMLHGRFPGSQSRFCTYELKIEPMERVTDGHRLQGIPIIQWLGERAQEGGKRVDLPVIDVQHCAFRAPITYVRPIHSLTHREVFDIAKRHGLKPNPLYLMGFGRVGCFCIMSAKDEVRRTAQRFPGVIDRIDEWEHLVGGVARHAYSSLLRGERGELVSSFLPTDRLPFDRHGNARATIRRAVEWSKTGRGGTTFDMLITLEEIELEEAPSRCQSKYGLCE